MSTRTGFLLVRNTFVPTAVLEKMILNRPRISSWMMDHQSFDHINQFTFLKTLTMSPCQNKKAGLEFPEFAASVLRISVDH